MIIIDVFVVGLAELIAREEAESQGVARVPTEGEAHGVDEVIAVLAAPVMDLLNTVVGLQDEARVKLPAPVDRKNAVNTVVDVCRRVRVGMSNVINTDVGKGQLMVFTKGDGFFGPPGECQLAVELTPAGLMAEVAVVLCPEVE